MIDYKCPNCGADMSSPNELGGKADECPQCGQTVRVAGAAGTSFSKPAVRRRMPFGIKIALATISVASVAWILVAWFTPNKPTNLPTVNNVEMDLYGVLDELEAFDKQFPPGVTTRGHKAFCTGLIDWVDKCLPAIKRVPKLKAVTDWLMENMKSDPGCVFREGSALPGEFKARTNQAVSLGYIASALDSYAQVDQSWSVAEGAFPIPGLTPEGTALYIQIAACSRDHEWAKARVRIRQARAVAMGQERDEFEGQIRKLDAEYTDRTEYVVAQTDRQVAEAMLEAMQRYAEQRTR